MSEPTQPRWLTEGRKRVAACEPFKVGSDPHLLEMAIGAYVNVCNERDAALAKLGEIDDLLARAIENRYDPNEHEDDLRRISAVIRRK